MLATIVKGNLQAIPLYPIAYVPRYRNTPDSLHITLAYGVSLDLVDHWIDVEFWATLTEEAWNDKAQAFRAQLPDWVICRNQYPHLTLSWQEGVKPVEANNIWKRGYECRNLLAQFPFAIEFDPWEERS